MKKTKVMILQKHNSELQKFDINVLISQANTLVSV
jgi:hypothetical protein